MRFFPSSPPSSTGRLTAIAPAPYFEGYIGRQSLLYIRDIRGTAMADEQTEDEERPCLHCLIVDVVDSYFAEYPVSDDEPDAIDTDEVLTALAKTVAELTCSQDAAARQSVIEQLMRGIMEYDAEYRQQDEMGRPGSHARH
jgi:hypothetical protein